MNRFMQHLTALTLGLVTSAAMAALPTSLTTHNLTNVESNAYVAGTIPSPVPTKANSNSVVPWLVVQMACYGRSVGDICQATIKMATNTANPVDIGDVYLNMKTGEITPTHLSGNGYTFTVNGIAEVTLTKD
ncbi:MAG: hypothetical protein Q8M03_01775 [Legionella sp.]|nr:hypothetical protein [Legionella sp.]